MDGDGIGAGRGVVITGASTGIGHACAVHLDSLGFRVFAGVRRAEDAEALTRLGSARLTPIFLDVTNDEQIAAALAAVSEAVGDDGLAGLVNNAGVVVAGPLEMLPMPLLRRQFEVNVLGQIAVTQAFLPLLRKGRGRVVNMSSVSGRTTMAFMGPYSASKHALEALSDALRMELQPWGIHVSIIEPGNIKTPIWEKSLAAGAELVKEIPPQAIGFYGLRLAALRRLSAKMGGKGIPPSRVARAVAHALTAKRPKARYPVGPDAQFLMRWFRFLPDRVKDFLAGRNLERYVED